MLTQKCKAFAASGVSEIETGKQEDGSNLVKILELAQRLAKQNVTFPLSQKHQIVESVFLNLRRILGYATDAGLVNVGDTVPALVARRLKLNCTISESIKPIKISLSPVAD